MSTTLMPGTLYVVSLPIGNAEDITVRALRILQTVAVVAAENPEKAHALFGEHGITTPLTSYNRTVQEEKAALLIARLREGQDVALVSDEGTPSICDPGTYLVSCVRAAGLRIASVPGPSALLTAFAVSGFKSDAFIFVGDMPRTSNARLLLLRSLRSEIRSVAAFVSTDAVLTILHELHQVLGNRRILIACEMTKPGEQYIHGTIATARKAWAERHAGGDVTLIIEGRRKRLNSPLSSESARGRNSR